MPYLGVGVTVVASVPFFSLFDRHPTVGVTLLTCLVPVIATLTGRILFGEHVTLRMAAGFLVVLVDFCGMRRRKLRAEGDRVHDGAECGPQR